VCRSRARSHALCVQLSRRFAQRDGDLSIDTTVDWDDSDDSDESDGDATDTDRQDVVLREKYQEALLREIVHKVSMLQSSEAPSAILQLKQIFVENPGQEVVLLRYCEIVLWLTTCFADSVDHQPRPAAACGAARVERRRIGAGDRPHRGDQRGLGHLVESVRDGRDTGGDAVRAAAGALVPRAQMRCAGNVCVRRVLV
jgi:hypothetical protein